MADPLQPAPPNVNTTQNVSPPGDLARTPDNPSPKAPKNEQPTRTVSFAIYSGLIVAFPAAATVNRLSGLTTAWSPQDTAVLSLVLVFLLFDYLSSLGWIALETRDQQTAQTLIRRSPYWLAAIDAFRVLFFTMFIVLFRGSLFSGTDAPSAVDQQQAFLAISCFALFLICGLFWTAVLGPHDISAELKRVIEAKLQREIDDMADGRMSKWLSIQCLAFARVVFSFFMRGQQIAYYAAFPLVGFGCLAIAVDVRFTKKFATPDLLGWFPHLVCAVFVAQVILKIISLAAFAMHDKAVGQRGR